MIFDVDKYVVNSQVSIKDAMRKVDDNQYGFVFGCDKSGKIIGLATDGDIRRGLIDGLTLDAPISKCLNLDFVSVNINTPRQQLIKKLDSHISFIPVLDMSGKLTSIISKDYLPLEDEKAIYIRSRAPVRVSFGGGGSDLTHYFENNSGVVINTAVSIYSHGVMKVREDSKIIIKSLDLDATLSAINLEDALSQEGPFGLIQSVLHVVRPQYGFELSLYSDFPVGSGLGGSATLSAVVLGCFNMLRTDQWNQHELSEIAFQAERLHLGIAGGWQDQYAAVFGGFNFIEFSAEDNIVSPIRLHQNVSMELEESLVLCNTGIDHSSGEIHKNQKEKMASDSIRNLVKENVELTYSTRKYLLRGDLVKFGECLDKAWRLKKKFSDMISSDYIDDIYEGALKHGATGGKLLGAGGGGFFIFYVSPFKKHNLMKYLISKNLIIQPFRFEPDGLKSWITRENLNNKLTEG